jgi:hypothetical protein
MHTTCTSFYVNLTGLPKGFFKLENTHCFFFVFDMIKMKTMYYKFLLYF